MGVIVGWWIGSIKPEVLVRPEIILIDTGIKFTSVSPDIYNCYFWLSMKFVFVSIDSMRYWNTKDSNLESKITHTFDVVYIVLYLQRLFSYQIGSSLSIKRLDKCWFT